MGDMKDRRKCKRLTLKEWFAVNYKENIDAWCQYKIIKHKLGF